MSARLLSSFALALALVTACKGEEPKADGKGAEAKQPETKPEAKPEPPQPEPTDTAAKAEAGDTGEDETGGEDEGAVEPLPETFEKVGVAACDDYVGAYERCIADKVPEADREAQRRIVFENVESWQQTAKGGPAAEKGLQTACKIATEQAKRTTQGWGCEW